MKRKMMWFALSKVQGLDIRYLDRIFESMADIEAFFRMRKNELRKVLEGLRIPERILESLLIVREFEYFTEYEDACRDGIHFVTREDQEYPGRLRNIPRAPYYLYYKGRLPLDECPSLAIIGARNCSVYGQEIALCFSKVLAECGVQIISGMARGIDGYAHKGALQAHGYTC